MALSLAFDKSQAPLLKITVTESDPSKARAYPGGRFELQLIGGGNPIGIDYAGGVLPFYGYTDSANRVWTKVSDDGLVAVFTAQA
jgi:hypothetical protein